MDLLTSYMPEGEPYYDEDQITDFYERDIAIELIRQAVLESLHDEVPHAVGVRLDEYADRADDKAYISATLFVERDSQKGILIGKNGSMIKEIGMLARKEIEELTGRQVFLDLRVKVHKNWRNNPDALKLMGYGGREE
jgi:GTP-binding protein Era